MKNKLFYVLFALPVTTGICGAVLRATQLKYAYDSENGLLKSGAPVTYGLVGICIIAVLMALIAAFITKNDADERTAISSKIITITFSVSAVIILVYAAMTIFGVYEQYSDGEEIAVTQIILALFSIYTAISFFTLGKYHLEERDSTAYCIFSAVPVFWACFMLILTFREKIPDPILSDYVTLIFSDISILFFAYSIAAHVLGKTKKPVSVFSCFVGIFFILVELLSPIIAAGSFELTYSHITELLPQLAFLIIMPCATAEIIKK